MTTNSVANHSDSGDLPSARILQVGVVGAGLAGLSAAIGLARAGHQVEIFEKSMFKSEIGAAINVCPNATRVLTRWEFDFTKSSPTIAKGYRLRNEETHEIEAFISYAELEAQYGYLFYCVQRVDLHTGLKTLLSDLGAKLVLGTPIADLDCEAGVLTTAEGASIQKDLVVVADGVHAKFTEAIAGRDAGAVPTGQDAFRFQIHRSKLEEHPLTRQFMSSTLQGINVGCSNLAPKTRLVWYPCRNGEIYNFTGIHPRKTYNSSERKGWDTSATISDLLETYEHFGEPIHEICRRAEEVKLWPLYSQSPLERWTRGKAVAIGDAIHAMMPHHGQGGGLALEDGACLEILFSRLGDNHSIRYLLELFQKLRRNRCSAIQIMSRVGQDQVATVREQVQPYISGKIPENMEDVNEHNYGHDVVLETRKALMALSNTVEAGHFR